MCFVVLGAAEPTAKQSQSVSRVEILCWCSIPDIPRRLYDQVAGTETGLVPDGDLCDLDIRGTI